MADGLGTRERLVRAGSDLFRRQGFVGTRVDEVCAEAGLSKGAFFHHFDSKEDLALACLAAWNESVTGMLSGGPFRSLEDPVERLSACLAGMIERLSTPGGWKSCLAGTTAQEVAQTHPALREASQACFADACAQIAALIDDAAASTGASVDASSLSELWMATMQGALVLCKASGDEGVIRSSLTHVKTYIEESIGARATGS